MHGAPLRAGSAALSATGFVEQRSPAIAEASSTIACSFAFVPAVADHAASRQTSASSARRARASSRRSAINSSTTLTPGLLALPASRLDAPQRPSARLIRNSPFDDLGGHGIAGLHHHRRAHLGGMTMRPPSPILSLACRRTDGVRVDAGSRIGLRFFRDSLSRVGIACSILSANLTRSMPSSGKYGNASDGMFPSYRHYPSAMISRPISQRRISLVPAPIS